jgi:hypothetical protein
MSPLYNRGFLEYHCQYAPSTLLWCCPLVCRVVVRITLYQLGERRRVCIIQIFARLKQCTNQPVNRRPLARAIHRFVQLPASFCSVNVYMSELQLQLVRRLDRRRWGAGGRGQAKRTL